MHICKFFFLFWEKRGAGVLMEQDLTESLLFRDIRKTEQHRIQWPTSYKRIRIVIDSPISFSVISESDHCIYFRFLATSFRILLLDNWDYNSSKTLILTVWTLGTLHRTQINSRKQHVQGPSVVDKTLSQAIECLRSNLSKHIEKKRHFSC